MLYRFRKKKLYIIVFFSCYFSSIYLKLFILNQTTESDNSIKRIENKNLISIEKIEKGIPIKITETNSKKYLVYFCDSPRGCGGLADRIKGIMSVYALALLTDRQLIINMTFPCRLDKYLIPNEVDWNQQVPTGLKSITAGPIDQIKTAADINQLWNHADVVKIQTNLHVLYSLSLNKKYQAKIRELGYLFVLKALFVRSLRTFYFHISWKDTSHMNSD